MKTLQRRLAVLESVHNDWAAIHARLDVLSTPELERLDAICAARDACEPFDLTAADEAMIAKIQPVRPQ